MTTVQDIYNAIDGFAPFAAAEEWDNVGLLVGDGAAAVSAAVLALDLTDEVLAEAVERQAQLVITHHPVIFEPLKQVETSSLIAKAVRAGVHAISAHTSLDLAPQGVNQALAETLELKGIQLLCADGLGRVGDLPYAMSAAQLAGYVKERLGCGGVRYYGAPGQITRVALCGGAGGSLVAEAAAAGAQALVTADVKHSAYLDAAHRGLTLLDGGHFATENVIIAPLAALLAQQFPHITFTPAAANRELCSWL